MKIKTLPNGKMNLEGLGFVTQTGYHCHIGPYQVDEFGIDCHYVSWVDDSGILKGYNFGYTEIVACFANKTWRIKQLGKPVKMLTKFKF